MYRLPSRSYSTFRSAMHSIFPPRKLATELAHTKPDSASDSVSRQATAKSVKMPVHPNEVVRPDPDLFAYAYVSADASASNIAPFIIEAILHADPGISVQPLPSSRGSMLLRFLSLADREAAIALSPISYASGLVRLQRPEHAPNRATIPPRWRSFLFILDYPFEHSVEDDIKSSLESLGTVVEIDPVCLTDHGYSALRVVTESKHCLQINGSVWVEWENSPGATIHVRTIQTWKPEDQVDAKGNHVPFFSDSAIAPGRNKRVVTSGPAHSSAHSLK
ncbi:unnamed protein product [Urochloa humidicola]